jgi:hypothetical protein
MVIVQQTTHGAYILTEMDHAISKLRFAAFCVIPYHAQWRTNIDLETFFVFPDANEETENVEDEMETDEDIQDTAGLEEEVPSDDDENHYRLPLRYHRQINGFRHIPAVPKRHTESSIHFCYTPFHSSVLSLCFISPFYLSVSL